MTEPNTEPDATELLGDLRSLRDQARADRRGYAFPLFLFGGLVLFAPLLYSTVPIPADLHEWSLHVDPGPFPAFTPMPLVENAWLVDWYWMLVIVGGLAATGWWYRRRAQRFGVESSVVVPFAAAGAALLGLLVGPELLDQVLDGDGGLALYSTPAINLPILFGSIVLSALTFVWAFRPHRTDRARVAGVFTGTMFAMLAFSALFVYMRFGYAGLLVIAVALLVLAWWERSVLLGVVATLFTAVSVPASHALWYWDLPSLFDELGWSASFDARLHAFQTLLVPGLVLAVGGAVAALTRHGAPR